MPASDSNDTSVESASAGVANNTIMEAMKSMMDRMHQMQKKGNIDYDLAMNMKEHHKGAIDMATAELNSGTDEKLKAMAGKMKEAQQKEITSLDKMISKFNGQTSNYDPSKTDNGLGKAIMDNMQEMMRLPEATGTVDKDFATMMIKHHKDGIKMGEHILQYSKSAEFKTMTMKMIADQKKEIEDLEKWLSANQ
ncbi:DUF305 domain-containing protein [Flavobacterium limi]|nr:DUF305 domain-containing protein [Flavobacterium limi]